MPIRGEFPGMVGFVSGFPFPAEKPNIKKRGTGNVKNRISFKFNFTGQARDLPRE
jgi:hypothetical protein